MAEEVCHIYQMLGTNEEEAQTKLLETTCLVNGSHYNLRRSTPCISVKNLEQKIVNFSLCFVQTAYCFATVETSIIIIAIIRNPFKEF